MKLSRRTILSTGGAAFAVAASVPGVGAQVDIEQMRPGEYLWRPEAAPEGAVAVIASLPEQRVHVYRNGVRIGVATCSSGKAGHETPTGVFTILQKDRHHRSSTYNNAPMPNMNRLTWGGIALHAGHLPGYPASHGCVRLPMEFSKRLFEVTHIGTPVIVSGARSDPWELVHPGIVLAQYGEDEMTAAVAKLNEKSQPANWGAHPGFPITTVLVTRGDSSVTIMEDGQEVMRRPVTFTDDRPLGNHVFVLQGMRDRGFHWTGLTHHEDPAHPLWPEEQILNRVLLDKDVNAHIAARLHPGLTFVISELSATPDRRSGRNFVIMTAELAQSPRPRSNPRL